MEANVNAQERIAHLWTWDWFEDFGPVGMYLEDAGHLFDKNREAIITTLTLEEIKEIVLSIENATEVGYPPVVFSRGEEVQFKNEFNEKPIPLPYASTGTKTALLVAYYAKLTQKSMDNNESPATYFIDLTECGPNALEVCLDIISYYPNIIGVTSVVTRKTGPDSLEYGLQVNDEAPVYRWLFAWAIASDYLYGGVEDA